VRIIRFASLLVCGVALGLAPEARDHQGTGGTSPSSSEMRPVDESPEKPPPEGASRYLPCSEGGAAVPSSAPLGLGANRLVRALIVTGDKGTWSLATPKDVEEGFVRCSTIVANVRGQAVGRYTPTFKGHFGCDSEPFVSAVPGGLVFPTSPARENIRYFPIRPPGAPEDSEIYDWVPTPCGMQDMSVLVAMDTPQGDDEVIAFESSAGRAWTAGDSENVASTAMTLLRAQAPAMGRFAEASRQCLTKWEQRSRKKMEDSATHVVPKAPPMPTSLEQGASEISTPFSPSPANTDGDQSIPAEFFDDGL
jgi:hypothetical protein